MNLTLSCLVIFLAFAMTCLTGPVEGRPHHLHEHARLRSSRSHSGSGSSSGSDSDSRDDEKTSDEFDPCAANPCKNNGTCSNTGIDYECACPINYHGKNCEEFDPCAANPCKNNGTCSNTGIDYECACPINYVGKNCEEFDPCAANPCKNNGTCSNTGIDYECACPINYVGKNCEDFDPCAATPCKNNGTCNETGNDYQCACAENFVGKNCEGSCQPGWVPYNAKCYYFSDDRKPWEEARDACVSLSMNNGYLVEVNDLPEQNFLISQVYTDDNYQWIGANDLTSEGVFTWTGTGNIVSFTFNNYNFTIDEDADCVELYYFVDSGYWATVKCHYNSNYICEMKPDYN